MSIVLSKSVFKDTFPCIHVVESGNVFRCLLYGCDCYFNSGHCNRFKPVDISDMNISDELTVPEWKKVIEEKSDYCIEYFVCSNCNAKPPKDEYGSEYLSRYCPSCGEYLTSKDEVSTNIPTGRYKHYKGNMYDVIGVGKHSETGDSYVIYRNVYNSDTWIRPLDMFLNLIEDVNMHYRGPRFLKIDSK